MSKNTTKRINIFLFLLPALFLFVAILVVPIVSSVYYSFFNFSMIDASDKTFVLDEKEDTSTVVGDALTAKETDDRSFFGKLFENYIELFENKNLYDMGKALKNAFILAALSVFIQLPLSLGLALMLGRGIKGERLYLSVYFVPVLISSVVIGALWSKIYDPSQPEEAYEIFTDRESLHEMNGRWVRIAMIIGILIGIMTLIALWRLVRRLCLPSTAQFLTLFIESAFLLRGAFIMNSQDMNRKRAGEKNLLTVFFLALTIGLFSFMILENARPHTQSLMISGDIDEPINGERFNDFKIYYPDFYYMDLEAEAAEPMTLEIVNSDGEAFWSQTGTRIGGDRIRIRLPRGEYCFSLTCTTGYRVDYTLN